MRRSRIAALAGAVLVGVAAIATGIAQATTAAPNHVRTTTGIPRYDHVVVVIFENTDYSDIVGSQDAPYFNQLAGEGALLTHSFGVTHPSQGNYLALYSGDTQNVNGDDCPNSYSGGHLGKQLVDAGLTFKAYSEDLPEAGYADCTGSDGEYVRKHAPWVNFDSFDQSLHVPFSDFPADYSQLPTVSFVVPNMCNDIHDCDIATGDTWLKDNLDGYAQWAKAHNSLLVTTFDEDNFTSVNQIYTSFVGQGVTVGESDQQVNHYNVLRTLEDMYGLPPLGNAEGEDAVDVFGSA